jgi:hypothetical protein
MKTAYEIAMEKLQKEGAQKPPGLSEEQKKELSEIRHRGEAKIAEKRILLRQQMAEAVRAGEFEKAESLQEELVEAVAALEAKRRAEEAKVRGETGE